MNSSASFLWVHVKEARISEPDPNNRADVQVSVQVGSLPPFVTAKSPSPNPKWNEDVMLTVSDENMMESLCVEVFKPKFLFRRELLGKTSLPMVSIRHSNKPREGFWVNLFLPSGTGSNMPTQHQIKLDTHFELPKDIPADVIELLEKKLETFNEVLEEETEVLETQEHRIITGALTPPPSLSCEALDKLEEVAPMEGELEEQLTEEIREESVIAVQAEMLSCANPYMDAGDRLDTDVLTYEERETSPSSHEDTPPIPHKDTPPFPQEDLTDGGSGDVRLSSDELDVPLEFENFEWSRRDSTDSAQLVQQRQQQQRRQQQLQESEEFRRSSMPAVVVTNLDGHNEGAAASGYRKRPSVDSALASVSHGAGVRSLGGSVESIPFQLNDSSRAKANWKLAFTKMLPEVKKNIVLNKPSLFGFSTLSQLVDQLQSVKTKSKLIVEQNIGTFSTVNSQFRTRSRSVLDVKKRMLHRKHFLDERVKMDVYKRALEALLYPASEPDSHMFEMWSARKPTTCSECNYLLWGLKKQGVKCTRCGKVCHERCASLSIQDCFVHDQHSAIQDKMHRMLVNHANRFETVQQAFSVSKEDHTIIKDEVESRILKMADNFNAEIKISVLSAQSLVIPKNLSQRIYVSVSVGDEKKKTEVFKRKEDDKNPPTWDEEFIFNCNNYHDAIQLRVWNERDSAMAKVATRFTKEGDLFLGQKIIEVRRVGASQEVWYKLEKRTEKGPDVSGHIKVNISVNVEGESSTPFHQQYIKLHEQLFFHCHVNNEKDLIIVPSKMSPGDVPSSCPMQLLPPIAQEVVDEFALRYAIEPIFRMMIHIELLVNHHSIQKALVVINNMLKNLKYQMFVHIAADHTARAVGATTLMEEYMDASNFGRDKFSKLLDKLLNSLRLDLQQYREFYPHKDEQKLSELVDTFELLATVIEFQQQAMGILTTGKANELILHAMKECLKNTFDFIVQSNMNEEFSGHPALDPSRTPFDFFYQSIIQIKSVILEDRTVYGKYIPKFCKVNFGDISAVELWHLFSSTIEGLFENNANLEVFSPNEYITLLFTLKSFYDAELKHISSRQGKVPEYPHWFVHPVKRWLQHQYQKEGMVFLNNAWDDDKNRLRFASHENQKLSSSTFQMFFYLHQV